MVKSTAFSRRSLNLHQPFPIVTLSPGGHLAMSEGIVGTHNWREREVPLASGGWRPGVLLNSNNPKNSPHNKGLYGPKCQ